MIEEISSFFTLDMIYLWLNFGVLPFWFTLIFFPNSKICSFAITSIFPTFIFTLVYSYLFYIFFFTDYNFLQNFNLYLGIDEIQNLFSDSSFLILFWIHFLAVNLFCGCWILKDSQKFNISKYIVFLPLVVTYFVGPLGMFIYWLIRIISAKRFNLID